MIWGVVLVVTVVMVWGKKQGCGLEDLLSDSRRRRSGWSSSVSWGRKGDSLLQSENSHWQEEFPVLSLSCN